MTRSPLQSLVLAIVVPPVLWGACSVIWLAAAAAGLPRGADGRTLTLTEAAAIASHADVARLLRSGADPNAMSRLRAGLVRNDERVMTPLEAATRAIRTGPLQLLAGAGARIDEGTYPVLWCAATTGRNQEMLTFLDARRSAKPLQIDCATVRKVW